MGARLLVAVLVLGTLLSIAPSATAHEHNCEAYHPCCGYGWDDDSIYIDRNCRWDQACSIFIWIPPEQFICI